MGRRFPQSEKNQSNQDDWQDALALAQSSYPSPAEPPSEVIPGQALLGAEEQAAADTEQWPPEDAPEGNWFSDLLTPEPQEGEGPYFLGYRPKGEQRQEFMDLDKTYAPPEEGLLPQDDGIIEGPGLARQGFLGDEKTAAQIEADKIAQEAGQYQQSPELIARRENIQGLRSGLAALKDTFDMEDPMLPAYEQKLAQLAQAKETNEQNLLTAIDKQKETPYESFWSTRSTGQKIAAAIGLALGTLGGVATGGRNLAAEMIHKSIRDDARMQVTKRKLSMQGEKDRFSATRRILGDNEAAVQAQIVASYNKTRLKLQQHRQKVTDVMQISKLDALDMELLNAEKAAFAKAKKALNKDERGVNVIDSGSGMMRKAAKFRTAEQGGRLNYPTNPEGKPLKLAEQKVYNDSKMGFEQVQKIRKLLSQGKGPGFSKMTPSLYNHAISQLVEMYGRMRTGAVISSEEMAGFEAKNPTLASEMYDKWTGSQEAADLTAGLQSSGSVRNTRLKDMEDYFQNFSASLTGAKFTGGGGARQLKSAGKASQ